MQPVEGPGGRDRFEPPERSGLVRGVALVVLALVIGILLLPSATRAPLSVVASRAATSTSLPPSKPPTSSPRSSTTPTTAPAPQVSSIQVLVANATDVNGVAGSVTSFLKSKGFGTLSAVNALVALTSSQLYFTSAGSSAQAAEVAAALGLSSSVIQPASSPPPVKNDAGASVVVVAGQDLASRFAPTTTTTS